MADGHAATFSIHGESSGAGYKAYSHIEAMIIAETEKKETEKNRGRVGQSSVKSRHA
jgi:hypothetical protein